MRKWLPAVLVLCGYGLSLAAYRQLPETVPVSLDRLLPFAAQQPDPAPRTVIAFGLPTIALLTLLLLHEAPVGPLGRFAARLLGFGDAAKGRRPVEYDKFAGSYRLIVAWAVMIVLSMHVAVLSSALGWYDEPGTIVGIVLGAGLVVIGNIMPRLRPNPVAGIRTARTMSDPQLWSRVHRVYGAVWVVAGIAVLIVAIVAPPFALMTAVIALLLSALAALATPGLLTAALIIAGMSVPIRAESQSSMQQSPPATRPTMQLSPSFEAGTVGSRSPGEAPSPTRTHR